METDTEATAASLAEKMTVLDAVHMASTAWNEVKPVTIGKCFKKAFSYSNEEHEAFNPLADVLVPSNMGGEEFEAIVEQDIICGKEPEEEYEEEMEHVEEEEEEEEEEDETAEKVSPKECLHALKIVRSYCQSRQFNNTVHKSFGKIENQCVFKVAESGKVQKWITDFFQK